MPGEGGCIVLFLLRPLNAGRRLFPRKRHADGFGTFNFATLVFLLLARHSPQAVSARAACVGCHQKYRESRDDVAGVLYLFSAKSTDRSLRLVLFAAFWSAVNRGLRPRGTLYFLTAKSTKNSPADAFAYFVPSNVRNGRLFAGLQANRPRFLPLLAGTSFHGSGIGPGSFAAIPSFRPGKEANTRTCEHANRGEHLLFACSRRIPASPLEAVLNRRILACSGESTVCEKFENLKTIHPCIFANNPGAGTVRTTP